LSDIISDVTTPFKRTLISSNTVFTDDNNSNNTYLFTCIKRMFKLFIMSQFTSI